MFADCAIRNGLLKTKTAGKPTAKLSAKESIKLLKDIWATTMAQLEQVESEQRVVLQATIDEIGTLLGKKKPSDEEVDKCWMCYQHVKSEMARFGEKTRIGSRTSHGAVVDRAEEEQARLVQQEPAGGPASPTSRSPSTSPKRGGPVPAPVPVAG